MCLSKGLNAVQIAINDGVLPTKTLGFIPTAGEPYASPYFVDESRLRLQLLGINLVTLDISNDSRQSLINKIDSVDGIFVAGGNVFFLLQQLCAKQLNSYIIQKVKSDMPYFGESAGAVILTESVEPAETLDNPKDAPNLKNYAGLGLINFFPLPHVDREKYASVFAGFIAEYQTKIKIVKFQDNQAILTKDGINYEIMPSGIVAV